MALIEDQVKGEWKSTPSALLDELRRYASEEALRSSAWPRSARGLTAALTRLAPNLRAIGYDVDLGGKSNGSRITRVTRRTTETGAVAGSVAAQQGRLQGRLQADRPCQKASNDAGWGQNRVGRVGCAHTLSMHTLGEKEEKEGGEGVEVKGKGETDPTDPTDPALAGESGAASPGDAASERDDHQDAVDEEIGPCICCNRPADRFTPVGKPICSECVDGDIPDDYFISDDDLVPDDYFDEGDAASERQEEAAKVDFITRKLPPLVPSGKPTGYPAASATGRQDDEDDLF